MPSASTSVETPTDPTGTPVGPPNAPSVRSGSAAASAHSTPTDCPLCAGDGGRVIWRDAILRVVQIDDADYPGFCRIIWNAHIAELSDLPVADRERLLSVLVEVEQVVRAQMQCDKINLASFGNMVPHLHWHVIPRFHDDAHFPQAIWAARERDVAPASQAARVERARGLADALSFALRLVLSRNSGDNAADDEVS